MSLLPTPAALYPQEALTSPTFVALWLRFQCNPAETLHESYREMLDASAKPRKRAGSQRDALRKKKGGATEEPASEEAEQGSVWLKHLWGTSLLSRFVCERFSLRCDAWPRVPSDLPFFLRLVMLDSAVLLRLLRSVGLVLSAPEIAAAIDREEVARLRGGLGEEDYTFAMTKGARLRPSKQGADSEGDMEMRLLVAREHRASLADPAFHTVVGLRLLLLQGEGLLSEQHWRRLALKCPCGIVDLLRHGSAQELEDAAGLDEGTAAGLQARLAVFETEGQTSGGEIFWGSVAKEVIGSWHVWLVSSKAA